ncbi:MAG: DUF3060 domain-containing protein [Mycobacterium sp.]
MDDGDPEKRIRELERELADVTRGAPSPPYTADVPPPRRKPRFHWYTVVMLVVMVLSVITGLVAIVRVMALSDAPKTVRGAGTTTVGPTAVPQGGELRVTGNNESRTIACNDGTLTFTGFDSKYVVTGHCAGLTVGGFNNNVTVDSADTLEATGYGSTITDHACTNATVKLSSYGIAFNATGHCTTLTISSYDNRVTVDSVDTITVSGYNNTVTYHSGAPKITDSGYDNNIQQG